MAKTKETTEVNFVPFQEVGLLFGPVLCTSVPLPACGTHAPDGSLDDKCGRYDCTSAKRTGRPPLS